MHKTAKMWTTSKQLPTQKKGLSIRNNHFKLDVPNYFCNNLCWKKINIAGIVWIISLPGRSL